MINSTYKCNFKGAFLIKTPTEKVKEEMPEVIGKKKQIFYDFNPNGDVLYVMRDSSDKRVLEYIKANALGYEYYPHINTKSGLDNERPEEARAMINASESTSDIIKKQSKKNTPKSLSPFEYINNIVNTLGLDAQKVVRPGKHKYRKILDSCDKVSATISQPGEYGICFVIVEPKHSEDKSRFLAMNEKGEILQEYKSLQGIHQFKLNFNKAINYNPENKTN